MVHGPNQADSIFHIAVGKNVINVYANFFDTGGHSLTVAQLISRIRAELQVCRHNANQLPVRLSSHVLRRWSCPWRVCSSLQRWPRWQRLWILSAVQPGYHHRIRPRMTFPSRRPSCDRQKNERRSCLRSWRPAAG